MASLEFDEEAAALYLKLRKGKVSFSEPLADNMLPREIKPDVKAKLLKAV
jgi:hypothetical protein